MKFLLYVPLTPQLRCFLLFAIIRKKGCPSKNVIDVYIRNEGYAALNIPLSERLRAVASYIPKQSRVADIGSDHAYLASYLIQTNTAKYVIAGEVNEGPFQSATRTVRELNLTGCIDIRKGDGLQVLQPGEIDTVVIAGMGGGTIQEILQASPDVLEQVTRLILQPMNHVDRLRKWLYKHNWHIVDECLIFEDDILYDIIAAEPGQQYIEDEWMYAAGPSLYEQRHPLLSKRAEDEVKRLNRVIQGMQQSQTMDTNKIQHMKMLRNRWEEVLNEYINRGERDRVDE